MYRFKSRPYAELLPHNYFVPNFVDDSISMIWRQRNEKKKLWKKEYFSSRCKHNKTKRNTQSHTHTRTATHYTNLVVKRWKKWCRREFIRMEKKIRKSICASCVLSSTKLEFFLFRLYAFLHFFFCFRSTSVWLVNWRCSRQYAWMRTIVINVCMKGDEKCQRWEKSCTHVNLCSASCKNLNTEHGEQRTQTCMQMELISNQGKNVCG